MRPIVKLIKPDAAEAVLFVSLGFIMLLLSNINRLWNYFSNGVSFSDISNTETYGLTLQEKLLHFESTIDPRFADFTVWIIVGAISVTILLFAQHVIEDTEEELEYTNKIVNSRFKNSERLQYVAKMMLRVAGVLLLLIWVRIFFGAVFSEISQAFLESVLTLNKPASWVTLTSTTIVAAVGFYTIAICLRLITLRTRVFG